MAEVTINESPDNSDAEVAAEASDWQSTLAEMQISAPEVLKPVFSRVIPPENRSPENNRGLSADMTVSTTVGVIAASRIDYHRANWHSVIALSLKPTVESSNGNAVSMETLAVSMPNPESPKGLVTYTRFTAVNPEGIVFKPRDEEFAGFKKGLLRTVRGARLI
jgi:hypothetical protein